MQSGDEGDVSPSSSSSALEGAGKEGAEGLSAFGLPLRTTLPQNTALLLSAGLSHFNLSSAFRVEMAEAVCSHLEALKELSDLHIEMESCLSKCSETLKQTDPRLSLYLAGLSAHQENVKRYIAQIVDELYTAFVIPYRLLLDPATIPEFERLEQLHRAREAEELLATIDILCSNHEHDTVSSLTSFISLYSTAFQNSKKSLESVHKLVDTAALDALSPAVAALTPLPAAAAAAPPPADPISQDAPLSPRRKS